MAKTTSSILLLISLGLSLIWSYKTHYELEPIITSIGILIGFIALNYLKKEKVTNNSVKIIGNNVENIQTSKNNKQNSAEIEGNDVLNSQNAQ